jgi:deoxyribonuclease-4
MADIRTGGHLSIRKGYAEAAKTAARMGAGAFQYFPKNPRSLRVKNFDPRDAAACRAFCLEKGIVSVAHAPYPVNPAADPEAAEPSVLSTLNDLAVAEACGSVGVVVHFGAWRGNDPLQGYRNVIGWLNRVLANWRGEAKILLENEAGERGTFGVAPEELAKIRELCERPEAVGFCLDVCHLFASGQWDGRNGREFAERARGSGYFAALAAVHCNDSPHPCGSRRDRHAPVGAGQIGEAGFRDLLRLPEIRRAALLLETPVPEGHPYAGQMALLRRWCEEESD